MSLASNNGAVTVPVSVTLPAGYSSAGFTASISSVTTTQTATLTASAGGVSKTFGISMGRAAPALTVGAGSIAFGTVDVNNPANQSVTLTSSGTAALIISAGGVTGSCYSISGISFPATLNPGQGATLYVQFDPTTAGTATGRVTFTTNASPSTATIGLSGTGATVTYQAELTWAPPTNSSDPVAGYNIYCATGKSSTYQLLE